MGFKTPLQKQLQLLVVKNEVVTVGEHVRKVATKVDTFEEKVSATKKLLEENKFKSGKGGGSDTGTCQENTANEGGDGKN